jgi:hypothetical protein
MDSEILLCSALQKNELQNLLSPYQLTVITVTDDDALPGSFWGDPEAGLWQPTLYTPCHSRSISLT